MNSKRALRGGIAGVIVFFGVLLFQGNGRIVRKWATRIHVRAHQLEFEAQFLKDELALKKHERDEAKFAENIGKGNIIGIPCPVASVSSGDWMRKVEGPIHAFARSNNIEILRFQSGASTNMEVCVRKKDARLMWEFVESLTNQTHGALK